MNKASMSTIPRQEFQDAAERLYQYLLTHHWNGSVLIGPDSGIRFNSRAGRFIKSYLSFFPWSDNLVYAQAQKYWIQANWLMSDLGLINQEQASEIAVNNTNYLLGAQRPEGYWEYPNPEWRGRIATVEGNYAAIGMLDTYLRTGNEAYLNGAKQWYAYAVKHIGFQYEGDTAAINYFGNVPGGRVPNNSASALRTFALLAKASNDEKYLQICQHMVAFLRKYQTDEGELPYGVHGTTFKDRPHFLCHQYNAFQLMNLVDYFQMTKDMAIWPVLTRLSEFVASGVTASGAARYDCLKEKPEVPYYTAALGAALSQATSAGLGDYRSLADKAFRRVLSQQAPDGSFFYSTGNYKILTDRRAYPRYLAMILSHLLMEVKSQPDRVSSQMQAPAIVG